MRWTPYIFPNWVNALDEGPLTDELHQLAVDDDAGEHEHHVGKAVKEDLE